MGSNHTCYCSIGKQVTSSYTCMGNHKSQGLTLTIDLGPADFSSGLSFVAISHVKTMAGIAFWSCFDHHRLLQQEETDQWKCSGRIQHIEVILVFSWTHMAWIFHNIPSEIEPVCITYSFLIFTPDVYNTMLLSNLLHMLKPESDLASAPLKDVGYPRTNHIFIPHRCCKICTNIFFLQEPHLSGLH